MSQELEFAYRLRLALDQGADDVDAKVAERLRKSRQAALDRLAPRQSALAAVGGQVLGWTSRGTRGWLAAMALMIGAVGAYYWNNLELAEERAEIDTALLTDEVPFAAYLDQGFTAWLDHVAQDDDSES